MADITLNSTILLRNDTSVNWTNANPVLKAGEMGIETDTRKFKFGDGSTDWKTLKYAGYNVVVGQKAPSATDSDYDIGTMWVDTNDDKAYIIYDNTSEAAVWKQIVTPDELSALGAGDMLKSQFANNPKAEQGYVNAAVTADTAESANKVAHALTAGSKTYDGSAAIEITADDLGALTSIPEEYVGNTDYGTAEKGGVVKSSDAENKVKIETDGTMTMGKAAAAAQADNATAADSATKLSTARDIALTGDVTGSVSFDGSANASIAAVLADSGAEAGTYTKVTVDTKGRVTQGAKLSAEDIPDITLSKVTDAGTAASKNVGTSEGNVPVLGANGKLDNNVIPAVAITDTFTVDSESAMTGLNAQKGDIAIRTDVHETYILSQEPASEVSNWKILETPTDAVTSVNGKTGVVTLTTTDVTEGDNLYFTEERATANFKTHASTELTDSENLLRKTDTFIINGGKA